MSVNEFEENSETHCQALSTTNELITEEGIEMKSFEVDEPNAADRLPRKLIVDFNDGAGKGFTLQDAFIRYQQKRQKELRRTRKRRDLPDEVRTRSQADPKQMWKLRMMFLNQAKKYFGTPYAKKYWAQQDPEYYASQFLDCCGLIRQVLRDLKKEFGFRIGPWNQSYLCDTLPITIEKEEHMKPGDLVFISAIYHNQKMKKQKHNLTHVEIWLGDGPKTIGARWQRGKVQVFDSYQFNATSYHSPVYIFKSIDTWLMGICRSHCPEHTWKWRSEVFTPEKKSVFYVNPQLNQDMRHQEDEGASDSEQEPTNTNPHEGSRTEPRESGKVDKAESAMLQEPSNVMTRALENETSCQTVGLTGGALSSLGQESLHTDMAIKSSVGVVLKSDDDPDCLDHDRESCSPDCCSDQIDRRSSCTDSPDSDCYESCEDPGDDHEFLPLNCDKNDCHAELLNCTSGDFSCDRSITGIDPDFQNLSTDMPSCVCPSHNMKHQTLFENERSLQNFHKLSLNHQSTDNSSSDAM